MSTDHTSELVNILKDIKDTLAAQTDHLKTNSLLLQALLELNQREAEKKTAAEKPSNNDSSKVPEVESKAHQRSAAVQPVRNNAPEPPDIEAKALQDSKHPSGKLEQPGETTTLVYAKSEPDLISKWEVHPEWKLRNSYVLCLQKEQKGYHIDDHLFTTPRPLDPLLYPPGERNSGFSRPDQSYDSYAFSMTRRVKQSWEYRDDDDKARTTGLGDYADILVDALNNLYSVPADTRLPLGFEPLTLRRMRSKGELDGYLIKATQLLENLHQAAGTFILWDYDACGNHFCYYPSDMLWSDRDELFDKFPVTNDSIRWHRYNENRRVDRYYKLIPKDIYLEFFQLLTAEEGHWYAGDWASCARKWLRLEAHIDDGGKSQTIRPWYRIIDVNGLELIDAADVARMFVHFLFSDPSHGMDLVFQETGLSLAGHLELAVTQHLKADPLWGTAVTASGQWDTFHISWYRVSPTPYKSCWGYGPLYLEDGYFLSRQSFSVTMYNSNYETVQTGERSGPYWTLLVLPPPEFYVLPEESGDTFWNSTVSLRTGILEFIDRGLSRAAKEWAELDPYFDRLDAKRELIFNPEQHDSLLFDDRHFSRSRLYFWAINGLGRFIQDINVTIERWEMFWERNERHIRRSEQHLVDKHVKAEKKPHIGDRSVDELLASVDLRIQSLKNTRQGFEARRQKIIEYRDGLFNASSVIETREATRLSQNVKLLTFVSIFYLPLGFCMSMWSINEDYNATNLVIVTICIGMATYLVVANLETTVHALQRGVSLLFNTPRQRLVKKMLEESDTRCRFLGEEMSKVPLSREDAKPSEWLIFGYWCTTIHRSLKSLRGTKQERVEENEKPVEEPQGYWLTSIYRSLQTHKEKPADIPLHDPIEEQKAQLEWLRRRFAENRERRRSQGRPGHVPEDQKSGEVKGTEQTTPMATSLVADTSMGIARIERNLRRLQHTWEPGERPQKKPRHPDATEEQTDDPHASNTTNGLRTRAKQVFSPGQEY
ncbi:hypothetical protein QBC45DRAFT_444306 [Copromyces sp. CBS 386.78]|nr:hypothetical protein QBC45DRAFT_444306 [Copromyces sp. CBS 386.78]